MSEFKKRSEGFTTKLMHIQLAKETGYEAALVQPLTTSSVYHQDEPDKGQKLFYSRYGNPTRNLLEKTIAALDNGKHGIAFSAGVAATSSVSALLGSGDHILCAEGIYSGTTKLFGNLKKNGIAFDTVDFTNLDIVKRSMKSNTKMVWIESPTNPLLNVVDIEEICKCAHSQPNVIVVVDNTFLTPYFQNPLDWGADISLYSLSKYMNGHSDVVMGAVVVNDDDLCNRLRFIQKTYGAVPAPFDCYQVSRSLKTLAVRMDRHSQSAMKIAELLMNHPAVEKVMHPGLSTHPHYKTTLKQCFGHSGMISFYIKGGYREAEKFLKSMKVITLCGSLGGVESVASLPFYMSADSLTLEQRKNLGITESLVRLSVGLEDIDDLLKDLDSALHLSQN